jgi:hypothetical protein
MGSLKSGIQTGYKPLKQEPAYGDTPANFEAPQLVSFP